METNQIQQNSPAPKYANRAKRIQMLPQLLEKLHALICFQRENDSVGQAAVKCQAPYCTALQEFMSHVEHCANKNECDVPFCAVSTKILEIWENGRIADGKSGLTSAQPAQAAQNGSEKPRNVSSATDDLARSMEQLMSHGNSTHQNQSGGAKHAKMLNIPQSKDVRPVGFTMVNGISVNQLQVQAIPIASTKDWHKSHSSGSRNRWVHELLHAIVPTTDLHMLDPHIFHTFLAYAKKVEADLYEKAHSRSEYYQLMTKKFNKSHKIKEEIQAKHKQNIQKQVTNTSTNASSATMPITAPRFQGTIGQHDSVIAQPILPNSQVAGPSTSGSYNSVAAQHSSGNIGSPFLSQNGTNRLRTNLLPQLRQMSNMSGLLGSSAKQSMQGTGNMSGMRYNDYYQPRIMQQNDRIAAQGQNSQHGRYTKQYFERHIQRLYDALEDAEYLESVVLDLADSVSDQIMLLDECIIEMEDLEMELFFGYGPKQQKPMRPFGLNSGGLGAAYRDYHLPKYEYPNQSPSYGSNAGWLNDPAISYATPLCQSRNRQFVESEPSGSGTMFAYPKASAVPAPFTSTGNVPTSTFGSVAIPPTTRGFASTIGNGPQQSFNYFNY